LPDIHFPRNSVSGNSLKNSLITGTLLLTLAGVLTRIIGFFYRIFLSRLIGAEGLGIYQLLSPVMALGFAVTAAGIQTASLRRTIPRVRGSIFGSACCCRCFYLPRPAL